MSVVVSLFIRRDPLFHLIMQWRRSWLVYLWANARNKHVPMAGAGAWYTGTTTKQIVLHVPTDYCGILICWVIELSDIHLNSIMVLSGTNVILVFLLSMTGRHVMCLMVLLVWETLVVSDHHHSLKTHASGKLYYIDYKIIKTDFQSDTYWTG
jgi:hypothetical protein